jgi:hypothetical protein
VLQENAFPDPRLAEDDERLPLQNVEVEAVEDLLGSEALRYAAEPDGGGLIARAQKSTFVRKKSAMRMAREPMTTALVVESPTPSAPPFVSYPH